MFSFCGLCGCLYQGYNNLELEKEYKKMLPIWSADSPNTLPLEGFPVETLIRLDSKVWSETWQAGDFAIRG